MQQMCQMQPKEEFHRSPSVVPNATGKDDLVRAVARQARPWRKSDFRLGEGAESRRLQRPLPNAHWRFSPPSDCGPFTLRRRTVDFSSAYNLDHCLKVCQGAQTEP